jgi:hypothetical protein
MSRNEAEYHIGRKMKIPENETSYHREVASSFRPDAASSYHREEATYDYPA